MTAKQWQHTIQRIEGDVYRITLNRPEKLNAFSSIMYGEVKHGVLIAGLLPEVDSIVIEGQPGAFATGGDLAEFLGILELPPEQFILEYTTRFDEPVPFRAILECPKPVVAKVDGLCLAGGLLVATTCDAVVATPGSKFGVPEGRVGLADPYCAALLPLSLGLGRARYLMLTSEFIDAATAFSWGLVHKLAEQEQLDAAVDDVLARLRRVAPEARRAYKLAANRAVPHMSVESLLRAVMTANGREGLRAFVEKRKPDWDCSNPLI
ncbi:MAG TPA: enoyl-CoA hydratase/isomerase family protein [Ottowia sp.]|uniref:enoyl-CoA hydratase/isomerase family protein n=1 Tax=Ottowia sp. TaxID=1898956 RepID=UPI002B889E5C|nr:enoyl-CoA hydratase/isomerase family protein [Ottowia sp.]HMN21721.1 enoyl-CoA hydratase/isomerase family protein [Ottowia sp.]